MDLNTLVTWIGTLLAGAVGVGVGYGTLREQIRTFKHEFTSYKLAQVEQYVTVKERLEKMENKTEKQVGYEKCKDLRDGCVDRTAVQFTDISRQISENRQIVTAAIADLNKTIGRVEQFMLKNGRS